MDEYWTIRQAADALQVHERTIRRWIAAGRLATVRIARTVRVPRRSVEGLVREDEAHRSREGQPLNMEEFRDFIAGFRRRHLSPVEGTDSARILRELRDGGWAER